MQPTPSPGISARLVLLLSIAAAATVANLYYAQPLLPEMARSLRVSAQEVGWVPVLTQVGYAVGFLLFVPLGDAVERRRLILALVGASAAALVAAAAAPGAAWLAAASLAVGFFTVVPHVALPLAAHLARSRRAGPGHRAHHERHPGRDPARAHGGRAGGRRASAGGRSTRSPRPAWCCSGSASPGSCPPSPPERTVRYVDLLASLGPLVRDEAELRRPSLIGAMIFASFSVFWTTLAFFLETPPYSWGAEAAGLFGLVGLAGASRRSARWGASSTGGGRASPPASRWGSRSRSFAIFALLGRHLAGLVLGVVLLDVGVQSAHVANLARIHALDPAARSRRNTVYMVSYFAGGALGTWLGVRAWARFGWAGVCAAGAGFLVLALLAWARTGPDAATAAPPRSPAAAPPR